MNDYLQLLDVDGALVELGLPEHPMPVPAFPMAAMRRSLSGSMIGGIAETQGMLDFCAEHGVLPEIELVEPDYINEPYERVLASDVRYRFVVDTAFWPSRWKPPLRPVMPRRHRDSGQRGGLVGASGDDVHSLDGNSGRHGSIRCDL